MEVDEYEIKRRLKTLIKEYNVLYDSEEEWSRSKESMKENFNDALGLIEGEQYEDAENKLRMLIEALTDWREAIKKKLNDE